MKVHLRAITSIRPYDKNPRLNDQAVDAVAASIREFGPFVTGVVMSGIGGASIVADLGARRRKCQGS